MVESERDELFAYEIAITVTCKWDQGIASFSIDWCSLKYNFPHKCASHVTTIKKTYQMSQDEEKNSWNFSWKFPCCLVEVNAVCVRLN